MVLRVLLVLALIGVMVQAATPEVVHAAGCGLPNPAFCDPLNVPTTTNNADMRSGNMNGVIWGVSRSTSADDPFQGGHYTWFNSTWDPAVAAACGLPTGTATIQPNNDVVICPALNRMEETTTDGGATTTFAFYPRVPFDVFNRTGKVEFDVSADSDCNHCAWPVFLYTDQPVPGPYNGQDIPRNSFGFAIDSTLACGDALHTTIGEIWMTQNWQVTFIGPTTTPTCGVLKSKAGDANINHFEVRMSPIHMEIWATDPGSSTLQELATVDQTMPLTRGLVWMEDVHYNANKDSTQGTHTFAWANFGFDGPVLNGDVGYDVQNANIQGTGAMQLGYLVFNSNTLNVPHVQSSAISAATGAILEFNFYPQAAMDVSISMNGNATQTVAWANGPDGTTFSSKTLAVPIPLSNFINGTNSFTITTAGGHDIFDIANIDIILIGAAGGQNPNPPLPQHNFINGTFDGWDVVVAGIGTQALVSQTNTFDSQFAGFFSRSNASVANDRASAFINYTPSGQVLWARLYARFEAIPAAASNHINHTLELRDQLNPDFTRVAFDAHNSNKLQMSYLQKNGVWSTTDWGTNLSLNTYYGLKISLDESGTNPVVTWYVNSSGSVNGAWTQIGQVTDSTTGTAHIPNQVLMGAWLDIGGAAADPAYAGTAQTRIDDVIVAITDPG